MSTQTPSESHQLQRPEVDKSTKMGGNQYKIVENTQNQNATPPPRDHNSSPAREQNWMENKFDKLTEAGFRRWVITNFSELKEHVLSQCKEASWIKVRCQLTRITSLEKNVNNLKELKSTAWELHETYTSFNSWMDQAEERISEVEDQLNEIKWEDKIRDNRMKRNKQSLQEI